MATHSSVLAWRIPGTGEPGGLQSMGSHRVKHDWRDLAAAVPLLYCFLYKQECHSICCGRVFLSGDLSVYVFYLWHLIPYIRIFKKLAKKHLSELGIRAKVLGWLRWIFHSSRIKPCQLSSPHAWYFPGRYQRYFCRLCLFVPQGVNATFLSLLIFLIDHPFSVLTTFLLDVVSIIDYNHI